jgi:hypothetical protein
MRRFDKRVKSGTKVKLCGFCDLFIVTEVHESRKWVKVAGLVGSFQWGDIERFIN